MAKYYHLHLYCASAYVSALLHVVSLCATSDGLSLKRLVLNSSPSNKKIGSFAGGYIKDIDRLLSATTSKFLFWPRRGRVTRQQPNTTTHVVPGRWQQGQAEAGTKAELDHAAKAGPNAEDNAVEVETDTLGFFSTSEKSRLGVQRLCNDDSVFKIKTQFVRPLGYPAGPTPTKCKVDTVSMSGSKVDIEVHRPLGINPSYDLVSASTQPGHKYETLVFEKNDETKTRRHLTDGVTYLRVTKDIFLDKLSDDYTKLINVQSRKVGDIIRFEGMRSSLKVDSRRMDMYLPQMDRIDTWEQVYGSTTGHRSYLLERANEWMLNGTAYGNIGSAYDSYAWYAVVKRIDENAVDVGFHEALDKHESYGGARRPITFDHLMENTVELTPEALKDELNAFLTPEEIWKITKTMKE